MGEPKKWTRAKVPKVRSGCITCKIRHLKCDERKPHCQRCENDGRVCDGYQVTLTRRPRKQTTPRPNDQTPFHRIPNARQPQLLPSLTNDISTVPTEVDLFHHVRTCTFQDLATSLGPINFWFTYALPLAHVMEPIKYAICALGGAHKYFKSQHLRTSMQSIHPYEKLSVRQYNQAIHHVKSLMQTPSKENMEVIIICCIIFICIENLHGRYAESLRHLRAGSALLSQLHDQGSTETNKKAPINMSRFFEDLSGLFSRLGQDVSLYAGDDITPDFNIPPADTDIRHPPIPFTSTAAAERSLHAVERMYDAVRRLSEQEPCCTGSGASCRDHVTELESNKLQWECPLVPYFHHWSLRFDLYKEQLEHQKVLKEEIRRMRMLSIDQALWKCFLRLEDIDDEFSLGNCDEIVQRAESIVYSGFFGVVPVFTFDARLIPAITMVCVSCADVDIHWRCIRLLRSIWRREGIWDSQEMADILEAMVIAREKDLVPWEKIPWRISHLVKMLSSFHQTKTRISSGHLSLADID
ncbi:hypothetical protein BGZ61DRAFT_452119 [Ilyonectria robusta]|uniref:uncharacterized protein n=1 Tax=Ilyonectria robusta TaxID=1079257 RepID=UPI001E8D8B61|nr:uncharacterized protein BGZ61DRAFT_452119 [Ilyonectria robusta]KAH8694570.1 hypothetical protein BGZ61DRAFT_452119 [Ilyonectria robusta]